MVINCMTKDAAFILQTTRSLPSPLGDAALLPSSHQLSLAATTVHQAMRPMAQLTKHSALAKPALKPLLLASGWLVKPPRFFGIPASDAFGAVKRKIREKETSGLSRQHGRAFLVRQNRILYKKQLRQDQHPDKGLCNPRCARILLFSSVHA